MLSLTLSLALSLRLTPAVTPPSSSALLLPLSVATNVRCVNRRVQRVHVCVCCRRCALLFFFQRDEPTHIGCYCTSYLLAESLLTSWLQVLGWFLRECVWVLYVCLFGLTLSAGESCVGVTLPCRPCLPEVDTPYSPNTEGHTAEHNLLFSASLTILHSLLIFFFLPVCRSVLFFRT